MKLPILYKFTSKGQAQQWAITVEGDSFFTEEGIVNGKITKSLPTKCQPKNVGRSNETTGEQQAMSEAKARWQKKLDKGYNETITDEKKFLEPMLAFEYAKYPINWEKEKMVYIQPKLDGLRCINDNFTQKSRNGKPWLSTPHLNQNELCLDGELYTHEYKEDFNTIVSLCKKQKPTEQDFKDSEAKVQLWVYDAPQVPGDYKARYEALAKWHANLSPEQQKHFVLVPTFWITTQRELEEYHERFLSEGYEGTIVRRLHSPYEFKRTKALLKYKDWKDDEFKIIGYKEGLGNRAGMVGAFLLQHDLDKNKTFESNVKASHEELKKIWQERDSYIGKMATVKYFNRTPVKFTGDPEGGKPRFGTIIKLDRASYE